MRVTYLIDYHTIETQIQCFHIHLLYTVERFFLLDRFVGEKGAMVCFFDHVLQVWLMIIELLVLFDFGLWYCIIYLVVGVEEVITHESFVEFRLSGDFVD